MDTIVLFDPGIRSLNKGDEIIMQSAEQGIMHLLDKRYVIKCATHAPAVTCYQNTKIETRLKAFDNAVYKFICGSNLLWDDMLKPRPLLNVNLWNSRPYNNSILLGVGTSHFRNNPNWYTRKLYSQVLSKKYIHSVRDDQTKALVEKLGYRAINTGCPTMWGLTEEFCSHIPTEKADSVVFTLTDYGQSLENDQILIDTLKRNYNKVYFWIQGTFDKEYFDRMQHTEGIEIVPPSLEDYHQLLCSEQIDYVGTRLHGGMFALQHQKRTIILSIDNRVRDMQESYSLPVLERSKINELEKFLNKPFETNVRINQQNIQKWLSQFERAEEL